MYSLAVNPKSKKGPLVFSLQMQENSDRNLTGHCSARPGSKTLMPDGVNLSNSEASVKREISAACGDESLVLNKSTDRFTESSSKDNFGNQSEHRTNLLPTTLLLPSGFRVIPWDPKSDVPAMSRTLDLASTLEVGCSNARAVGEIGDTFDETAKN
ncbi:hypothetical protein KIW84_015021 [Lathyrus oleraceus]|uniref:Uncharacterized protein n=1 Tax=Pisum sativum TaxID=3888 RepID=A0A9D5BPM2_PEA|nr:hypothetical protein KIW84_015019 [Pisum sativum]KAI5447397.1 hypothetical protein KIW84_015021 [Pisum sativum]